MVLVLEMVSFYLFFFVVLYGFVNCFGFGNGFFLFVFLGVLYGFVNCFGFGNGFFLFVFFGFCMVL